MMKLNPGDLILKNKYRIERLLGSGAFSKVYLVHHLELDLDRAIKVLIHDAPGVGSTQYSDYNERFRMEAQIGAKLNTPYVVKVYDFEEENDSLCLMMEYLVGGSLADFLKQGELPLEDFLLIGLDAALGLGAIHSQLEIVHRDIKPSNILLTLDRHVKVSDLGLAQIEGAASRRSQLGSMAAPHPGTPLYMSPEQEREYGYLQYPSDVYSLGCVMFEMLTGKIYKKQRPGTQPRLFRTDTPEWLDQLVARCLEENKRNRPWDGNEVAEILRTEMVTIWRTKTENAIKSKEWETATQAVRLWLSISPQDQEAINARALIEKGLTTPKTQAKETSTQLEQATLVSEKQKENNQVSASTLKTLPKKVTQVETAQPQPVEQKKITYNPETTVPKKVFVPQGKEYSDDNVQYGQRQVFNLPRFNFRKDEEIAGWLLVAPWFIGFITFFAGPTIASFYFAFTDWKILTPAQWVGLSNFTTLFSNTVMWQSLKVTTIYAFISVPLQIALGLYIALLINEKIKFLSFFRTIFYLPSVVSSVATAFAWAWIFHPEVGLFNTLLSYLGIKGPSWFSSSQYALSAFIIMSLWGMGGGMIIFLAALQSVPTTLYEAADVDGANTWHRFRNITLPILSPIILFQAIVGIIAALQTFTHPFIITHGGPGNATLFLMLYIYTRAFAYFEVGYASSIALILFIYIMILTLLILKTFKAWIDGISTDGSYFSFQYQNYSYQSLTTLPKLTSITSLDFGQSTYQQSIRTPVRRITMPRTVNYVLLVLGGFIALIPFIWMLSTSLKATSEVFVFPPTWIPSTINWSNYIDVFTVMPFARYFMNTLLVTVTSLAGMLFTSSIAGYAFARLYWRGKTILFILVLCTIMLPSHMTMIPKFSLFHDLGWLDTYYPLIVPALFGTGIQIFLFRQFFVSIPHEIEDAARVDGCGFIAVYRRIIIPLSKPVFITSFLLSFHTLWNEFLEPLIYLSDQSKFTLSIGLAMFENKHSANLNLLMAASILTILPVLVIYCFGQRYFFRGIIISGMKGYINQ